jgi:3-oxoacyl-[acyl-carrier protein] reductase
MKNVIITGTSRGIGYELVKMFVEAGFNVLALSRNSEPVSRLKLGTCTELPFDITNSDDIQLVSNFVTENWTKVDILINNLFIETTLDEFKSVYDVNVFGTAALTKAILPYMDNEGHVVNISSMGGVQGSMKFPGLSAYSSSKGALITLTELLAEEYKDKGPSFNVLALGAVQTEMLEEAFPGYKASISALQMANYIMQFSISGQQLYNGKLLQVSNSTP